MGRIPISPKYGVNPSCTICFFCREASGIALFGRMKGDVEAPSAVLIDYEPCNKCKELFKQGSLLLEVDTCPHIGGQPAIQQQENQKLYPTGRYNVIKKEACKRIFGTIHEKTLLDVETYNLLFSEVDKKLAKQEYAEKSRVFDGESEEYTTNIVGDESEDVIITKEDGEEDGGEIQDD